MREALMRASALLAGVLCVAGSAADTLQLAVGDPERKDHKAPVVLDAITDARTGEILAPDELARRLAGTRLLFIGEEHTNSEFHRVQKRVIESLVASGRKVLIGLEMFPYTQQSVLDRWLRGKLGERQFLEHWHQHWSYHWGYYQDIFEYAREHRLPLIAVNVPREVVKIARKEGFEAFDEKTRRHLPPRIDTESEEHRRLFAASFAIDDALHAAIPQAQREGLYRAQCTWDAAMGWNSAQALEQHGGADSIMIVLLGSGHVAYGLGAERQLAGYFKDDMRSLIPVSVRGEDGTEVNFVQASYADFLWGVPRGIGPEFPVLGVLLAGALGSTPTKIIQVEKNSVAALAGVEVGDVLVRMDGQAIESSVSLQRYMARYQWGDAATLEIERGEESRYLTLVFRRALEEPSHGPWRSGSGNGTP